MSVDGDHEEKADTEGQDCDDANQERRLGGDPVEDLTDAFNSEQRREDAGNNDKGANHPKSARHARLRGHKYEQHTKNDAHSGHPVKRRRGQH